MKTSNFIVILIFVFLMGGVLGYVVHRHAKPQTITDVVIVEKPDSSAVQGFIIKAKHDSVTLADARNKLNQLLTDKQKLSSQATAFLKTIKMLEDSLQSSTMNLGIATMDTTLKDHGDLSVWYWQKPVDYFTLQFDPFPLKEKVVTVTLPPLIVYKQYWYQKDWVWYGLGVASSYIVFKNIGK